MSTKRPNVMIVGAGGVAHVAAHKAAMYNAELGDICLASRTQSKCEAIIESVRRKGHLQDPSRKLYSRALDAMDISTTVRLIREANAGIVINLGSPYINMSVLEACLATGAVYIDTAVRESPDNPCEDRLVCQLRVETPRPLPRERPDSYTERRLRSGVVNAYCALAAKHYFDKIDTIDIMDVNAGHHGRYFATNFDPEINFREFVKVWAWIDRQWREYPTSCH